MSINFTGNINLDFDYIYPLIFKEATREVKEAAQSTCAEYMQSTSCAKYMRRRLLLIAFLILKDKLNGPHYRLKGRCQATKTVS